MEKLVYETYDEVVYSKVLENGLNVRILPKKGFHKTYALFSTNYGSIDNDFYPLNADEAITVPDGIAHFLEHKLFEKKTEMFSKSSVSRELRLMLIPASLRQLICFQRLKKLKKT